jgi:hypothetical protein
MLLYTLSNNSLIKGEYTPLVSINIISDNTSLIIEISFNSFINFMINFCIFRYLIVYLLLL